MTRRRALQLGVAAGAGLAVATAEPAAATPARPAFRHGVASGDPLPGRASSCGPGSRPRPDAHPGLRARARSSR